MNRFTVMTSLAITVGYNLLGFSIGAIAQNTPQQQATAAMQPLSFDDLMWVEPAVGTEDPSITVAVKQVSTVKETRTRTLPIMRTRAETRTRTVIKDGNPVEQAYTVLIPFTEMVEQTFTVDLPTASSETLPEAVPVSSIVGFDISGKKLDANRLENLLAKRTAVFLIKPSNFSREMAESIEIDPKISSVLREDTLILFIPVPKPTQIKTLKDPQAQP